MLTATGEAWKRQRRMLQAQFTGPAMRRYEQRITAAARRAADRWAEYARTGEQIDLGAEMRHFALDTIWRALTGHPLDPATERELDCIATVVAALPQLPDGDRADEAVAGDLARIDAVAHAAIAAARRHEDGPDGPGVLRVLLDAAEQHPEYTERLIRDELVTLLVAGHETTASTLTWLYLLLDDEPGARRWALDSKPRGLARAARGGAGPGLRDAAALPVRLDPPPARAHRRHPHAATASVGTDLLVCPYLTHRDPALWPDPERFDPARFGPGGSRPAQLGGYLPFGLGARACLGTQFALRESVAVLELLLPAFTVRFLDRPAGAVYSITVRPDGPTPVVLTAAG